MYPDNRFDEVLEKVEDDKRQGKGNEKGSQKDGPGSVEVIEVLAVLVHANVGIETVELLVVSRHAQGD